MLTFLKIIGTILLVILIVLLAVILLLLLVPFRYNIEFSYTKEEMYLKARVTWLLIFRFYLNYIEKKLAYKLKVIFIDILDSNRAAKKSKIKKAKQPVTSAEVEDKNSKDAQELLKSPEIEAWESTVKDLTSTSDEGQNTDCDPDTTSCTAHDSNPDNDYPQKKQSKPRFKFKLLHPAEIYDIISRKIIDFFGRISHTILTAERKLDKILAMIADPDNRNMVIFVISQLKALLKHILPKKHGIYVKAGFKDPATTGQALGAYSVINNICGLNFVFEPDFDNEVLEAKLFVKGRIRLINVVIIAIKVITNKTIRKFIRRN